jgi:hypothetical protein
MFFFLFLSPFSIKTAPSSMSTDLTNINGTLFRGAGLDTRNNNTQNVTKTIEYYEKKKQLDELIRNNDTYNKKRFWHPIVSNIIPCAIHILEAGLYRQFEEDFERW